MSSSTRPVAEGPDQKPVADRGPAHDALTVAPFRTAWGEGRLALLGDLPFELELPAGAAGRITGEPAGTAPAGPPRAAVIADGPAAASDAVASWTGLLERYFAGAPTVFPLDVARFCAAHGFTVFETAVYYALAAVPYGGLVSYRDLAVAAGRPLAWRAAGSAMALNPLPVILPCHRVVRSDGTLGHYGDDPSWKERLLRHEGVEVLHGPHGTPRADARLAPAAGRREGRPA
jgi:methylated-DNA-[protein]-cysteine S-methyltransferase